MTQRCTIFVASLICVTLAANSARAIVIELKPESRPEGTIIRLADVADVRGEDDQQVSRLNAVELFPAPAAHGWHELDHRSLLELLELRGFDPLGLSVRGAQATVIHGRERVVPVAEPFRSQSAEPAQLPPAATPEVVPVAAASHLPQSAASADPRLMALAAPRVSRAIAEHLRRATGGNYAWEAAPQLDPRDAELLASGAIEVDGGRAPWTGRQTFAVKVHRADGVARRTITADVSLPERVVAVSRPMQAGDRIEAADLQLVAPPVTLANRKTLTVNDQVVGLALTRGVAAGQALEPDMLRKPVVVRRNAVAHLTVRAGGVSIGTKVRALADGAAGDVIRVRQLEGREEYTATVVGPQQVEIQAGQ